MSSVTTSSASPATESPVSGSSRSPPTSSISESCLANWTKAADVEDGIKPGTTASENAELSEARKRIRLLEQENEVLRRAAAYLS